MSSNPQGDGRDRRGRFTKGTSGNPRGRPCRKEETPYDQADTYVFANSLVDVNTNGSGAPLSDSVELRAPEKYLIAVLVHNPQGIGLLWHVQRFDQ